MDIQIRKYTPSDYTAVMRVIHSEGEEWKDYFVPAYEQVLANSITNVASVNGKVVGYSRSIDDHGLYIWVIDLLVDKDYRGKAIGRRLMECLLLEYPEQDVFVVSDVDEYYQKLGYSKEGSVFRVNP